MITSLLGYLFGLLSGVRHAVEPDHLAAVSTIVAGERGYPRRTIAFALSWGLGHALVLFAASGSLLLLRKTMPASLDDAFELCVAAMLMLLGARAIHQARIAARKGPAVLHDHGGVPHEHASPDGGHVHVRGIALATRPLLVGVVHGLAGSGALTAIILSHSPSAGAGLVFVALYGLGATLGMVIVAGVIGVPLARIVRAPYGASILLAVTGIVSFVLGVGWGAPIALRLFS